MAGGNQILIQVGANTDKLRADLALAQADVAAFGKELRAAATEARDTGDYTKVKELAGKFEDARKSVIGLNSEIRNAKDAGGGDQAGASGWAAGLAASFGRLRSTMQPVMEEAKGHFTELHSKATAFGNAVSNTASSIFPHFREVLGLATIGGAAGILSMVEGTANWAHEIVQMSQRLGLSIDQLGAIKGLAKDTGVEFDRLIIGVERFGLALEQAANKQRDHALDLAKLIDGDKPFSGGGATVFRGGGSIDPKIKELQKLADSVPRREDLSGRTAEFEKLYNVLKATGAAVPPTATQWIQDIQRKLDAANTAATGLRSTISQIGAGGKESEQVATWKKAIEDAAKARELLAKGQINLTPGTRGEQYDRLKSDFQDPLSKAGISPFNQDGSTKGIYDGFREYAEKVKSIPDQLEKADFVAKTLGKRYLDLIPALNRGAAGLREFGAGLAAIDGAKSPYAKEILEGDELWHTLQRLNSAIKGLRNAFILPFESVFTPLVSALENFLKNNKEKVTQFARDIAGAIRPIAQDLGKLLKGESPTKGGLVEYFAGFKQTAIDAISYIQRGFELLIAAANKVAAAINGIFGTNLSGRGLLIAGLVLHLTGILPALAAAIGFAAAAIRLFGAALALIYLNPWTIAIAAIAAAALLIYANWDKIAPLFQKLWDLMQQFGSWVSAEWAKFWTDPIGSIKDAIGSLLIYITGEMNKFVKNIESIASAAVKAAKSIASALGLGGGSAATSDTGGDFTSTVGDTSAASLNAAGGYIRGPGTGTSDDIPARLSNGEFVVNASQTARHLPLLHAINNGAKFAMGGMVNIARLAMGGMVGGYGPSLPSFAGGGFVGSGGDTLHLTVGGQTYGPMNVPHRSTFDGLTHLARTEQRSSAGVKPSWYGR